MKSSRFLYVKCKILSAMLASLLLLASVLSSCSSGGNNVKNTPVPEEVEGKLRIYCCSVGAADAFLICTDNSAVLLDTGEEETSSAVIDCLKENCGKKLDCLIITHFDQDHVGGAVKVLKKCTVDGVIRTKYAKDSREYDDYAAAVEYYGYEETIPSSDLSFSLDGVDYTVCPPLQSEYAESPSNNSSLIVSVRYGSCSFLFAGDAEKARVKEFLETHTEAYDFVKIPYHGRWFKALGQLIQVTHPAYAVITCSEKEKEDATTIELLNSYDVRTFLTRTAPVIVKCDGSLISVQYDE